MLSRALVRAFSITLLGLGAFFFVLAPIVRSKEESFKKQSVLVDALVGEIRSDSERGRVSWFATVSYETPLGVSVRDIEIETKERAKPGAKISVLVVPKKPFAPRDPALQRAPTTALIGLLAIGALLIASGTVGLVLGTRAQRRQRPLSLGEVANSLGEPPRDGAFPVVDE